MGIGFVLLIWAVIGFSFAAVGTVALGSTAAYVTRRAQFGRDRLIVAARVFPFACLGWAAVVFISQATVNETVFHRDPGIGDAWQGPLPNGYAILMVDMPDRGCVYNPKTQSVEDSVVEQEDAPCEIGRLQVEGRYILGGRFGDSADGSDRAEAEPYFLLDTQTGKRIGFSTYEALRAYAQGLGIRLNLKSIESIYSTYRFTRFDIFVALLFFTPLLIGSFLLVRWTLKVRSTRLPSQMAA